ncbi:hypothetical protein V6N13_107475 [Hibiscus sabdariffa]|uniref:C2H2-type domain-containing protein n=1 Tax=Hibiscus sabdariffa TaxID=183260 RepID=A0ABR2SPF6_9ROSI
MEFRFRGVDDRSSNTVPSSSSGFNPPSSDQIFRPNSNLIRSRPEAVELEKLQIREEIIASEVARRIALEAEVRREMVTEWETAAMHRVRETGLTYEQSLTMHLDPRFCLVPHFHSLNRWRPEACFNLLPPPPTLLPSPVVLPPPLTQVLESEVKDASEEKKNRLIILPKPDPNRVVGAKWKTPPPAGTTELPQPSISSKVTQNEEWSCAICQINATSEEVLAGHLGGKKHKANEERKKAHEREKNSDTNVVPLPKKLKQSDEITEDNGKIKNEKDLQGKAESLLEKKFADSLEKKHAPPAMDEAERKSEVSLEKKHVPTVMNVVEMTPELRKKKKIKIRCEICSVDLNSEVMMETHEKGRKHKARLREIGKSNVAALATTATTNTFTKQATSSNVQLPEVADVVSDDGKIMDVPKEKNSNTSINTNTVMLPEKIKQLAEKSEDNGKMKDEQLIMREEKAESFTEKKIADSLEKKHAPTAMDEVEKKSADSLEKKHTPTAMDEVEKKSADSLEKKHAPTVMDDVEKKSADSLEKKHEPTVMDAVEMTPGLGRKKKFKFWCEICSIGVNSQVAMETHIKGRKHRARLPETGKSNVAGATTDTVTEQTTSNNAQMPKVADVVSDEAKLMDVPNAEKL